MSNSTNPSKHVRQMTPLELDEFERQHGLRRSQSTQDLWRAQREAERERIRAEQDAQRS